MASSVIRQKRESQNGFFKKTKHVKLVKNKHFLSPDTYTYVCVSGVQKRLFSRKIWRALFFVETPVLRFTLLP